MMKVILLLLVALCSLTSVLAACTNCAADQTCVSDVCQCNSASYTETVVSVNPPNPTIVCANGKVDVYIPKCQLEKNRYNSANVTLKDTTCIGTDDIKDNKSQVAFHKDLTSGNCGFTVTEINYLIIYTNTLYISPNVTKTVSRNPVNLQFSCIFPSNYTTQLGKPLNPKLGITQLTAPNTSAVLTVAMAVYKDSEFNQLVNDETVLKVEDTVYVSVLIPDLDAGSFSTNVVSLYATGTDSTPIYLIKDGCPNLELGVNLLNIIKNGVTNEARFTMKVFKISGSDIVNLFAEVTICQSNCTQNCVGAKIGKSSQNTATVSVQNLYADSQITSGAFDRFSMPWTLSSLLMSLLFVKLV